MSINNKINSYSFLTNVIKEQNYNLLKLIEKEEKLDENDLIDVFFKLNYYSPIYIKKYNHQENIEKKLLLKKIKKLSNNDELIEKYSP